MLIFRGLILDQNGTNRKIHFWPIDLDQTIANSTNVEINSDLDSSTRSDFNPSDFFIPGWKGEGLISTSAITIKNSINNLSIDALAHFKKFCSTSKSMKLQTFNEFLRFAEYAKIDLSLISHQNDFWLHVQDDTSPLKKNLEDFIKVYCFRAVAIYLFRIKFIMDLSKEQNLSISEDTLFNPLSFLGKIFKKDSSTELACESLQINQYSWYRPSVEYRESLLKLKEAFENVTLTEIIKLISTPKDDQIYSIRNYSHSLSHLSFGLFVNELLVKMPTWLKPEAKIKTLNHHKVCVLPTTINTRFIGNHVTSFALSHWLAQESNIKLSQWNNLICPEFEGQEFIDGQFLKICQELQFLSFLTRVAAEHKYEIVPFICKIMKEKYRNSPEDFGNNQASFLSIDTGTCETLYHRIVLNLTELPKSNPHHYLIQQILGQKNHLKKDGVLYVFSNQKLFVPSHSERIEQLLNEFKVEACFNLEDLKGKGEIAHFVYVLTKRQQAAKPTKHPAEFSNKIKESCLSFEIKGDLPRFNKFGKIVEEFQNFTRHKNAVSTPLYVTEIDNEVIFEFHQDAIIEGKLISSVSTKENGHIPHPSFFKNLWNSSTSLESFFTIEMLSNEDFLNTKKNLTSELLGLKIGPEKQYPLLMIINQTDQLDVKIELTSSESYRAKVEQYGTAFYHYFGLTPKNNYLNLNVFREYFSSSIGHQIIQLHLSDGPTKLKAKLKSLLVPSFFANNQLMPNEFLPHFDLLNSQSDIFQNQHPDQLMDNFAKIKHSVEKYSDGYAWHILSLLSSFKIQILSSIDEYSVHKITETNFSNPLITQELLKLKTLPIYPNNADVFIDYKIKTHQELQLPLTSLQLVQDGDITALILKHNDKDIVHLNAAVKMNQFIKFILLKAYGVKIADILINLKVPCATEIDEVTKNVELINNCKLHLLNETEDLIAMILKNQISR